MLSSWLCNQAFLLSSPAFSGTHTASSVFFFFRPTDPPTHHHKRWGDAKRNILLGWPNTIGYPEFEGRLIWGEPAGLAGLVHFTRLAWPMPCFLLKFSLCLYEAGWPTCRDLGSKQPGSQQAGPPAFQYKHNKHFISKQWAQSGTDCNWAC